MGFFSRKISVVVLVVIIGATLVIINPKGMMFPLRVVFLNLATPFEKIAYSAGISVRKTKDFMTSIQDLKDENETLHQQVAQLEGENASLKDMKAENDVLRQELSLAPRDEYQLLPALVTAQDSRGSGSWMTINRGEDDGIRMGMPVVASNRVLVGRVDELYPHNARVMLSMSPESSINGVVSAGETRGIVKGEYGLGLIFGMVLQSDSLSKGDSVVTSGVGGELPRGLLIGKVQEVRQTADQLYQQAILSLPVKMSTLHLVFVITKF